MRGAPRVRCAHFVRDRLLESDRRRQSFGEEVNEDTYRRQESPPARKHQVHNTLGVVPPEGLAFSAQHRESALSAARAAIPVPDPLAA